MTSMTTTTARAARITELEAELARVREMRQREAETRARCEQMTDAALCRLASEGRIADRVLQERDLTRLRSEQAARPVVALDVEAAGPDEALIGEIDGAPVLLCFARDLGSLVPFALACEWGGFSLSVSADTVALNPLDGRMDDMDLATWGRLRELASAEVVERLVVLARRVLPREGR